MTDLSKSFGDRTVIEVVTELHNHFKNAQSQCATQRGDILSKLEASDNADDNAQDLKDELSKLNDQINYYRVLSHSLSIADTVLHTEAMIAKYGRQ